MIRVEGQHKLISLCSDSAVAGDSVLKNADTRTLDHLLEPTSDLSSESEDSAAGDDELPVWVRSEQRWVSGVDRDTTCYDLKVALLNDEAAKVS